MSEPRTLPPRWNGEPVEWEPLAGHNMFVCPPTRDRCPWCSSSAHPLSSGGRMKVVDKTKVHWPLSLVAFRCPDCGTDTVHDMRTGEVWELDDSDYTRFGSIEPQGQRR